MRTSDNHPDILAEFFKVKNLTLLAWFGESEATTEVCRYLKEDGYITEHPTLRQVSEAAFRVIENRYRIEYVYKNYVLKKTIFGRYSPKTTSAYIEFPVGNARADVLVVNGKATIFEIKTQYDDYSNIEFQLKEYYRCFSEVTVLVHPNSENDISKILPVHVGISTLSDSFTLSCFRSPTPYTGLLDHETMFALLRTREREYALTSYGYEVPPVHPAILYDDCFALFRNIPITEAQGYVIKALRMRQPTVKLANLCSQLPQSLHAAAFSFRLRKADWASLIARMDQPV